VNFGGSEMLLVLVVILLLFGGKKLPELARSLGKGLAEFRRATQEVQRELNAPLIDNLSPAPSVKTAETGNATQNAEPIAVNAHPAAQPRPSEKPPESTA
jgi:sec-independent protein translocase protein TatA